MRGTTLGVSPGLFATLLMNRGRSRVVGAGLWVVLLSGCGSGSDAPNPATRPETRSVEPLTDLARWTLAPQPVVVLGTGDSGSPVFHRVETVRILPDGSYIVADGGTPGLLHFDARGTHLRTLGRFGFGPGEFVRISGVVDVDSTTLVVFDPGMARFTKISLEGGVVDTRRVEVPSDLTLGIAAYRLRGRLGPDRLVLAPGGIVARSRPAPGLVDESHPILVYDLSGSLRRTLEREWTAEIWADEQTSILRPFGRRTLLEVRHDLLYLADNRSGLIRWLDGGGITVGALELGGPGIPLSDSMTRAWLDRATGRSPDPLGGLALRRWFEQIPLPDHLPRLDRLVVDSNGRLWTSEPRPPGHGGVRRWNVIDPRGVPLAMVETPAGFSIQEVVSDRVLGIWTDSLGVQTVRVHTLYESALTPSSVPPGAPDAGE